MSNAKCEGRIENRQYYCMFLDQNNSTKSIKNVSDKKVEP